MARSSTTLKKGHPPLPGCETGGAPPKYDLLKEAQDLLDWSTKPDSTTLYDFTYFKDYLATELTVFAQREPKFALALKKAKERIGKNREIQCSKQTMNYGVWSRSAAMYDTMLKDHEEDIKDKEMKRRITISTYELEKKAALDKKNAIPPNDPTIDILLDAVKALKEKRDASERQTSTEL